MVSTGFLTHLAFYFQHDTHHNLWKIYQYNCYNEYYKACIGEINTATFIIHKLMDSWINDFSFFSFTVNICLIHCIFLDDLSTFMNCTPPLLSITGSSFPIQDHLHCRLQETLLNSSLSTSFVHARIECHRTIYHRVFVSVFCYHQCSWHGLSRKACSMSMLIVFTFITVSGMWDT